MSVTSLTINFANSDEYILQLDMDFRKPQIIPDWTRFEKMSCPGNIEHGPNVDYCRLGVEIDSLIKHFSKIKSTDKGVLVLRQSEEQEVKISTDGQEIFYIAVWYILLYSRCSVFKYNQWARSNYLPTSNPDRMFYILFSSFVLEDFVITPDTPPDVESFKEELQMMLNVLNSLLERVRNYIEVKSDSVGNGITLFSNLILLLDIDFKEYIISLREKIEKESVLVKWK